MLLRLLRFFVFVVAPAVLVASPALAAPEKVHYAGDANAGTIVIQSGERSLYLITSKDQALKYTVGVGRSGQQWYGTTWIVNKHIRPAWKPPASLRGKRSPDFYMRAERLKIRWARRHLCLATRTRHPRHKQSCLDRRPGVGGLHPHAQQGHHGPVRPRPCRYAGGVCKVNRHNNIFFFFFFFFFFFKKETSACSAMVRASSIASSVLFF